MSLWSRLFGRPEKISWGEPARSTQGLSPDTLLTDPTTPRIEINSRPQIQPWSAGRLNTIFLDYSHSPSPGRLAEARLARQCLSQFWLSAPIDELELLYAFSIGRCFRQMISTDLARQSLLREEEEWKDYLCQRLYSGFQRPETANILLALMPYVRPGKMKVNQAEQVLPRWLLEDYASLFEPELLPRLRRPQPTSRAALAPAGYNQRDLEAKAASDAPPLPRLSQHTGAQALAFSTDLNFLNRLNGLINLYTIDPSDVELREELAGFRRQLGQIWLDTPSAQVEGLFRSAFGDVYRKLLQSGYSSASLSEEDQQIRLHLGRYVRNMNRPKAVQAVLAVLPYYKPGKIQFAGGGKFMPSWLLGALPSLYVKD
ncbi:hypothetical protein [Synechococcus sp. CCY9202]|uniref:hypothetical protein n=1 Tax=Synechococcus sp. CCY9202 TaxID=174698 RepID=UPI002B21BE80|nr:hypothetical protein [Synechococcus sp. CCY9202]MEA5423973.1 hypothetical protein [Synechococcus sp. CCY9202]